MENFFFVQCTSSTNNKFITHYKSNSKALTLNIR